MDTRVVTVEDASKLSIPEETASALGLHQGSRLTLTMQDGGMLFQPLLAENLDQLCGLFSSQDDLVAELQEERRKDRW